MSKQSGLSEIYGYSDRDVRLLRAYGFDDAEYERKVLQQKGRCMICEEKPKRLVIDHDHETGIYRGLLCDTCNTGLGFFKDSPRLLAAAIVYLEDRGKKL